MRGMNFLSKEQIIIYLEQGENIAGHPRTKKIVELIF
jgi:hypothetical protein